MMTNDRSTRRRGAAAGLLPLFAATVLALVTAAPSGAQVTNSYSLQHNFRFTPGWWPIWNQSPTWIPNVWFTPQGYGNTWASAYASSWTQPPSSSFNYRGAVMPPQLSLSSSAVAVSDGSLAVANASVTLQPWGPWGTTLGTVRASGLASVSNAWGFANANSGASFNLRSNPGFLYQYAWWAWQPWFNSSVSGSASAWMRRYDPIEFEIYENGQRSENGSLLDVWLDGAGEGAATWENGVLTMNPFASPTDTMTLHARIGDPTGHGYIRPEDTGELSITYTGDTITDVLATGQFAGWALPTVGHNGVLEMNTPELSFGLDFQREVDARFIVGTHVGAPVPEPGTYGVMGSALLIGVVAFRRYRAKR